MKCSKLGDGKNIKKMKKLVYKDVGSVVINDNPAEVFNFAVNCLGSDFPFESDRMFSADAFQIALAFVNNYAGFRIEEC